MKTPLSQLFSLLSASILNTSIDDSLFINTTEEEWDNIYKISVRQGVVALVSDSVCQLSPKVTIPKITLYKFLSAAESIEQKSKKYDNSFTIIASLLKNAGIKCLLLKGKNLCRYYPIPNHREFCDLDIYSPDKCEEIDLLFNNNGYEVKFDYYRHSHFVVKGLMVENHYFLCDTRGDKKAELLDRQLKQYARESLSQEADEKTFYSNSTFDAIFNYYHAFSHFIFDNITLRHICDLSLFITKERDSIDTIFVERIFNDFSITKFASVITAISIHFFGFQKNQFPDFLVSDINATPSKIVDKVLSYICFHKRQKQYSNLFVLRLNIVIDILNNSWKTRLFLNESSILFIIKKTLPILF